MEKQFTEEEIKEKLDAVREAWLKEEKDESKKAEQKKMLVCENLKWLKLYRKQYPEGYEKYYWDNYRILEQDNVWGTSYDRILSVISMSTASVTMVITEDASGLLIIVQLLVLIMSFSSILLTIPYLRSCFKRREHSYYRIFVSMLDDLRKNEEAFCETDREEVCGEVNINDAKTNDRVQAVEKKKKEASSEPCKKKAASEKLKAEKKEEAPCTVQNAEPN